MNQTDHDQRSLAWHRHVVARMRQDEMLLVKARATLDHWMSLGPKPNRNYLAIWNAAIDSGLDAVNKLATAEGEHANNLRQSSPIAGVLQSRERWAFMKEWSRKHETRKP